MEQTQRKIPAQEKELAEKEKACQEQERFAEECRQQLLEQVRVGRRKLEIVWQNEDDYRDAVLREKHLSELYERERSIAEQDKELSVKAPQQNNSLIEKLKRQLQEQGEIVKEKEDTLRKNERAYYNALSREKFLFEQYEQERTIAELSKKHLEQSKKIAELDREIVKRNQEIAERNQEIEKRNKAIAEKNKEIEKRNKAIEEKDKEIAKRRKEIQENERAIAEKERVIEEAGRQLQEKQEE